MKLLSKRGHCAATALVPPSGTGTEGADAVNAIQPWTRNVDAGAGSTAGRLHRFPAFGAVVSPFGNGSFKRWILRFPYVETAVPLRGNCCFLT